MKDLDYIVKETYIDNIKVDDVVMCEDGRIRTVGNKDIKNVVGIGTTLFGDSYRLGYKKVKKLIITHKK